MARKTGTLSRLGIPLAIVATAGAAMAASVPNYITEQGRLFNAMGMPLGGTHSFVFSIYQDKVGMDAGVDLLWSESKAITLDEGYFSTTLGDTTPFPANLFDGRTRYLGIKVDADPEMTPRQPLNSVPYAYISNNSIGDITPTTVSVGGRVVIDATGKWVGDPTGLVGPAGPAGAAGAQGPAGPAGPVGPRGTFASTTCTWVSSGSLAFSSNVAGGAANCPSGSVAISGGYSSGNWTYADTCVPINSYRIGTGTGWYVYWSSPPDNCRSHTFYVYALCCTP